MTTQEKRERHRQTLFRSNLRKRIANGTTVTEIMERYKMTIEEVEAAMVKQKGSKTVYVASTEPESYEMVKIAFNHAGRRRLEWSLGDTIEKAIAVVKANYENSNNFKVKGYR